MTLNALALSVPSSLSRRRFSAFHSLSSYCVLLPENRHLLKSLGICIVYNTQQSGLHLIETELRNTETRSSEGEAVL